MHQKPVHPRRLDGSLDAALRTAVPLGPPAVLLLTFGDSGVMPTLCNFVAHASSVGAPFVIGAVDAAAFEQLARRAGQEGTFQSEAARRVGAPVAEAAISVYKTPLAMEAGYSLDGSNAHASSSWQRFAAMRTGEVARIVNLGYDVLHTDVDVAWLRNPAPYLACPGAVGSTAAVDRYDASLDPPALRCETLWPADVAVSTDNMSPGDDARGGVSYAVGGTLNTGMLLLRGSRAAARTFATSWHRNVVARACPHTTRLDCRTRCTTGSCQPDGSCAGDCNRGRCCTSDQQVLNRMVRDEKLPYPGIVVPRGAARTVRAANGNITLGALPLALFLHGHGYFVQGARIAHSSSSSALHVGSSGGGELMSSKPTPYAVHATYTLDKHDSLAKTQRFREGGLWRMDPPSYYDGRFLAYNTSESPALKAALEAHAAKGEVPANIALHILALRSHIAELRDALALARSLGRTLVLPRWTCYCDRLWSGSDDIFHFGCMYPGAQDGRFVPFVCPMDHVLSPSAWHEAGVSYRDAGFLDQLLTRHQKAGAMATSPLIREIRVAEHPGVEGNGIDLPLHITDVQAGKLLEPHSSVPLLRLSRVRGLLCGLEASDGVASQGKVGQFNQLAAKILSPPPWCSTCFQRCDSELTRWLDAETIARGAKGQGPNRWCAPIASPPEPFGTAAEARCGVRKSEYPT